jgi:tRNA threonylcarbamoyladenosine biosynthesis protein TsaB
MIGLDTATDDTAVAALRDGRLCFASSTVAEGGRPRHATRLLAELEEAAAAAGGWSEVGRIAVGVGPGSFTGLRIGIATARSLAQALEIELAPVGTLEALARGARNGTSDRPLLAVLDARRGELFAALFGNGAEGLAEPLVSAPEPLCERLSKLPETPLAVGSGALRFRGELLEAGVEIPADSDPRHRVAAAETCAIGAETAPVGLERVAPIYLRPPDAERWRERDRTDN